MPRTHRTLRLEQLESRCLLTAVVSPVVNGTVQITGSDAAESVSIRQLDLNSFKFRGDVAGGGVRLDGVLRIAVEMNDGADALTFSGRPIRSPDGGFLRALPNGVDIDMGGASDAVRFKVMDIKGQVEIRGDEGSTASEIISIRDSYWGGGANIQTGDGADQLRIDRGARLRGVVNIDTGFSDADADDFVSLGDRQLDPAFDANEFGRLTVNMHGGDADVLEVYHSSFNGLATFDGGDGDADVARVAGNDNTFNAGFDFENFEAVV